MTLTLEDYMERTMLQAVNGTIQETMAMSSTSAGDYPPVSHGFIGQVSISNDAGYWGQPIYWNNYPVYVCTDKTKKAIEVLKALQAEKLLKCDSVTQFIELVEKISGLL